MWNLYEQGGNHGTNSVEQEQNDQFLEQSLFERSHQHRLVVADFNRSGVVSFIGGNEEMCEEGPPSARASRTLEPLSHRSKSLAARQHARYGQQEADLFRPSLRELRGRQPQRLAAWSERFIRRDFFP
jgi:hypothetical protein